MTELYIRSDVRAFLDGMNANPRPALTVEGIPDRRVMTAQFMTQLESPMGPVAVVRDVVIPGPAGDMASRLFDARSDRGPGPVVVFIHGGGFVNCSIDTHASMCAEITRRLDLPVVSVEYRLAPEHPWPAAPDDTEAAARWIAQNGAAFGRGFTHMVLCGDSAGGNLTIVTALALRDRPAAIPLIAQIALYPLTDMGGSYPSHEAFADGFGLSVVDLAFYGACMKVEPGHWRADPLHADQSGLPATLVVTAALDPLRDQGRAYAAKTIAAGVPTTYREYAGTVHGFMSFRRALPSAQADFDAVMAVARGMIEEALTAP